MTENCTSCESFRSKFSVKMKKMKKKDLFSYFLPFIGYSCSSFQDKMYFMSRDLPDPLFLK